MPRSAPAASSEDPTAAADPTHPATPPRNPRRRFAWTVLGVAMLVGITPAYWWLSAVTAERSLGQAIDVRRQRGEPVWASDFPQVSLAPDRNAATYLRRAHASLKMDSATATRVSNRMGGPPPWEQEDLEQFRVAMANNAAVLADVRRARECPGAQWDVPIASQAWLGMAKIPRSYLDDMFRLAEFLSAAAVYQHQAGDDAGAVETARDILALARAIDGRNGLISHLSAFSVRGSAASAALGVAPLLSVAGRPASRPSAGGPGAAPPRPADEAQIRALIADFLDEKDRRDAITASWLTERAARLDEFRRLGRQGLRMRGVASRASVAALDLHDVGLAASLARDWPAAQAALGRAPPPPPRGPERTLAESAAGAVNRATKIEFTILTERRAAALVLAIRLYQLDHDGQRPAALAELVPSYLDSVPLDPFAADGHPFRYTQHASDRDGITAAVYSVAEDGKDDAGDGFNVRAGLTQRSAGTRWFTKDSVYRLEPRPQPSAPPPPIPSPPGS